MLNIFISSLLVFKFPIVQLAFFMLNSFQYSSAYSKTALVRWPLSNGPL